MTGRPRSRRGGALALALVLTLAAGCGAGAGESPGGASLLVTRNFGASQVGAATVKQAPGSETVMRFLRRTFGVRTRYGGGFVQSINGLSGGSPGGRPVDWFFYVNGSEAAKGAAATELHDGDRVWWDRHDWSATMHIPAVVGSFPEPFRSGTDGRKLPVRVGCDPAAQAACDAVQSRLAAAGVKVGLSSLDAATDLQTLRVLVGRWSEVRRDDATRQLDRGPGASGVYARFTGGGAGLVVLNAAGRPARTLGAGAGLIAATRLGAQAPTWVVAGTDAAGALAAARALDERTLARRFALAVDGGARLPAPVEAP